MLLSLSSYPPTSSPDTGLASPLVLHLSPSWCAPPLSWPFQAPRPLQCPLCHPVCLSFLLFGGWPCVSLSCTLSLGRVWPLIMAFGHLWTGLFSLPVCHHAAPCRVPSSSPTVFGGLYFASCVSVCVCARCVRVHSQARIGPRGAGVMNSEPPSVGLGPKLSSLQREVSSPSGCASPLWPWSSAFLLLQCFSAVHAVVTPPHR